MTDHTPQQESWRVRLNKLIKNDLVRKGFAIVTWGEEDYKPRTELEEELITFISSERIRLLDEVRGLVEGMKNRLVRCDGFIKWGECHCLKCRDYMVEIETLDYLLTALDTLGEQK